MARSKKAVSYEEELNKVTLQIHKHAERMKALEKQRRTILMQKEQAEMNQIFEVYKRSGLTPSEFISIFEKNPQYE